MRILLLTLLFGFVAALLVLLWLNRKSERIFGVTASMVAAVVLLLFTVGGLGGEPPVTRTFPVTFQYRLSNGAPLLIPGRSHPHDLALVSELIQKKPDIVKDGHEGVTLYHHFLQRTMLDWIALRHVGSWRSEFLYFELGALRSQFSTPARERPQSSRVISTREFEEILGSNLFARLRLVKTTLAVPHGTTVTVTPPSSDPFKDAEIRFTNRYCTLSIVTSPSVGANGIGQYALLAGIPASPELNTLWSQVYVVRASAKFTSYLIGSPTMAPIKRWAVQILDGLQKEFDEQVIWRRAVDNLLINEHSAAKVPLPPMLTLPPPQRD
jgi:hypothetical protein